MPMPPRLHCGPSEVVVTVAAKVYILAFANPHDSADADEILGVFSKPKVARREFDRICGMDTRGKWKKISSGMRTYDNYYITEYTIDEPLED